MIPQLKWGNKMEKLLIKKAIEARNNAYAMYSGYKVGAALLSEKGEIFTGCNIENSAYSPTVCAERVALFKAVSEGERSFKMLAISGGKGDKLSVAYPCGVCRQVLSEFCDEDMVILLVKNENDYEVCTLGELLPKAFDLGE